MEPIYSCNSVHQHTRIVSEYIHTRIIKKFIKFPDLSPTYYGDNKWGYQKWWLKRGKKNNIKIDIFVLF